VAQKRLGADSVRVVGSPREKAPKQKLRS
jgi:hypothetical protein